MSIKEASNGVTDMFKVPSDDQRLIISMRILKLRDNQEKEYVSRNQYQLVSGRIDQLIDEEPSVNQVDGLGMECIQQKLSQMKHRNLNK